jgi:hypothetical protein
MPENEVEFLHELVSSHLTPPLSYPCLNDFIGKASASDEGHTAQHLVTAVSHGQGRTWVRKRVVKLQVGEPPL